MTIDEAVASGWFDLPDEPGMVRIPISIDVMIPNHILFPSQPPEEQYNPDDPSGMAEDEDDGDARRRHAVGAIAGSFGTMFGPAADADRAAFRDMLKATPSGRSQGFPTLPVAAPIDTTDIDLPRIIVGGAPSGFPAARVKTANPGATTGLTAPASLPAASARQAPVDSGATGSAAAAVPSPIDPATLPQGPLNPVQYATVVSRNRYLASQYDPSSTVDQAENLITGAMSDPARVLTPGEQAEHRALSAAIFRTLVPTPTPDEARLDAMAASPLGAIAYGAVHAADGSQASQDLALHLGVAAGGIGLSAAGARAGPATAFLGAQTGGSVFKDGGTAESGVVGGAANPTTVEAYKDGLRAAMARPATSDPQLKSIMKSLYRDDATVGSGSTAAAVREELITGQPVKGRFHSQKAAEFITVLNNWMRNHPTASPGDRAAAENVIIDMQNALKGR